MVGGAQGGGAAAAHDSCCAQPSVELESTFASFFERDSSVQATLPLQVSAVQRARNVLSVVAVLTGCAPSQALTVDGGHQHDPGAAQGRSDPGDS